MTKYVPFLVMNNKIMNIKDANGEVLFNLLEL